MLKELLVLFHDRRTGERRNVERSELGRRRPTLNEVNCRLASAVQDFSETITLTPDKLKRMIRRVSK